MPELRKDPIIGRWVIISTERGQRPMNSAVTLPRTEGKFCPFCYGNEDKTPFEVYSVRHENEKHPNSRGWKVRVVPNKFPALQIEGGVDKFGDGMFDKMNGIGAHEVVIETPDHETSMEALPKNRIEDVLIAFKERIIDLRKDERFKYILIFKNHGVEAGASIDHPHSQLIALPIIPNLVREELVGSFNHYKLKERCVYCDIIRQEVASGVRLVSENSEFVVLSPYAPRFPFETWIIPKKHSSSFENSENSLFGYLAEILKDTLTRMGKSLNNPPYNLVVHTAPLTESSKEFYHWHIEIMPKLTRVAGFEWGTGFYINPTSPEEAATLLRNSGH
jgi:UDPglucose--hexose-1-phosphate uridylyltransferase